MSDKPELLFLAHRIPYPPNKGDKLRSYHMLRTLSERFAVHLGCFVDDPADWEHVDRLRAQCRSTCFVPARPLAAKARSLLALLGPRPLTLCHFWSAALDAWVRERIRNRPLCGVLAFSSPMAQFVPGDADLPRTVIDFIDVDSAKWEQYAERSRPPMRWIYRREARCLVRFEVETARRFDRSVFVSPDEADLFLRSAPGARERVLSIQNGVDGDYFDPGHRLPSPYPEGARCIAFTGAMDYAPNVEAAAWFAREVFPRVRAAVPDARFYVVGSNPADAVRRLGAADGVVVTGRVPDVRPYLAHARVAVAPLRVARGVQNKVLEALAMDLPVVATPDAVQGLREEARLGTTLASSAEAFAAAVQAELTAGCPHPPGGVRAAVLAHYDWSANLAPLGRLFEAGGITADTSRCAVRADSPPAAAAAARAG